MAGRNTSYGSGSSKSCFLDFDGASKGNPGQSGAGAVIRSEDGTEVRRVREGLGKATNNEAEYRALNRGMKSALEQGYTNITVRGDSQLVYKQVMGEWKTRSPNLDNLRRESMALKEQFDSFKMSHVPRHYNSEADAEANRAVYLRDGEVYEECDY